jgi:hypothetical protein
MNEQPTTTQTDEEMAAALHEALLRRSKRKPTDKRKRVEIPGELSFFLDELAAISGEKAASEMIAEVLDLGIVEWLRRLGDSRLLELGLPALSRNPGTLEAALDAEKRKVEELTRALDMATDANAQPKRVWKQYGYIPLTAHNVSKTLRQKPPSHAKKEDR